MVIAMCWPATVRAGQGSWRRYLPIHDCLIDCPSCCTLPVPLLDIAWGAEARLPFVLQRTVEAGTQAHLGAFSFPPETTASWYWRALGMPLALQLWTVVAATPMVWARFL